MSTLAWIACVVAAVILGTAGVMAMFLMIGAVNGSFWPNAVPFVAIGPVASLVGVGFAEVRWRTRPAGRTVVEAVAAALLVGTAVTFLVVGMVTEWHFATWEETICQGFGDLACDVGLIHTPGWWESIGLGAVAATLFIVGAAIVVGVRRLGSANQDGVAAA